MKIGLITDIHGNAPALKAVLDEFDKRQDIDHIYCLGDMIGIGPDTNEVLDALFSRGDVSMITGNHDEAVLSLIKGEEYPNSHSHAKEHHQWIADRMDREFISKLEQLPRTIDITIEGRSIFFNHYHMDQKKWNSHISKDPFSSIVEPSLNNLSILFRGIEKDLICFGHHHVIHFFENDNTLYLNPGSLGCHPKPMALYSIVDISKEKIAVNLEELPYDNSSFLASYKKLQVPEREFIMKVFHGNQSAN